MTQRILLGVALAASIAALILSAVTYQTVGAAARELTEIKEIVHTANEISKYVPDSVTVAKWQESAVSLPEMAHDRATVNRYLSKIGYEMDENNKIVSK
jgi:hypothetical protein